MKEEIQKILADAQMVLVGIGMDFAPANASAESVRSAYDRIRDLIGDKDYFVVTLKTDDIIYESSIEKERIVAPCGSDAAGNVVSNENYDESGYLPQWEVYTRWLQGTLNQKICILELGVGFQFPSVIRFPFEKVAYFNQKAFLVRIHPKLAQLTQEIREKGTSITDWPLAVLDSVIIQ